MKKSLLALAPSVNELFRVHCDADLTSIVTENLPCQIQPYLKF